MIGFAAERRYLYALFSITWWLGSKTKDSAEGYADKHEILANVLF